MVYVQFSITGPFHDSRRDAKKPHRSLATQIIETLARRPDVKLSLHLQTTLMADVVHLSITPRPLPHE